MSAPTPSAEERFPWEDESGAASSAQPSLWEQTQSDASEPSAPEAVSAEVPEVDDAQLSDEESAAPHRDRTIAHKEYYSISEVCELVGLKPHVLRYWETQFQVLNPSKNRSGNRVYQRKEIKLILLVKHLLYEEKYTVEGAKQKVEQLRRGGRMREATTRALDAEVLTLLRDEMRQLLKTLSPTSTT
jgi:DNA-binding transcriptional MerR regulator